MHAPRTAEIKNPVARRRPSPAPATTSPKAPTAPKVPARRPAPRETPAPARPVASKAYVADLVPNDEVLALAPAEAKETLSQVRALTVAGERAPAHRSIAEARGYEPGDLEAIAEIAYHYLMSGGLVLARTLYEGLTAIAPASGYYRLGLGLTLDRLDEKDEAARCYREAARLDPAEPRADLNLAELHIERGENAQARQLLARALQKAQAAGEEPVARKAGALLAHLSR